MMKIDGEIQIHSSDEFDEECRAIVKQELDTLGIKAEDGQVHLSFEKLIEICKHFYVFGDFIKEDYKHPEDKENE